MDPAFEKMAMNAFFDELEQMEKNAYIEQGIARLSAGGGAKVKGFLTNLFRKVKNKPRIKSPIHRRMIHNVNKVEAQQGVQRAVDKVDNAYEALGRLGGKAGGFVSDKVVPRVSGASGKVYKASGPLGKKISAGRDRVSNAMSNIPGKEHKVLKYIPRKISKGSDIVGGAQQMAEALGPGIARNPIIGGTAQAVSTAIPLIPLAPPVIAGLDKLKRPIIKGTDRILGVKNKIGV